MNPNDGRAPDTYEALNAAAFEVGTLPEGRSQHRGAKAKGSVKEPKVRTARKKADEVVPQPLSIPNADTFTSNTGLFPAEPSPLFQRSLQSYLWADNSCFHDTGMELLFRAFARWSPEDRRVFVKEILSVELKDSPAVICRLYHHYEARLKWILSSSKDVTPRATFKIIHDVIHAAVRNQWHLTGANGYGCAYSWVHRMITVCIALI